MIDNGVALITGVTGQDGAYLCELLLAKGDEVHGIKRRSSLFNTDRIDHLYQDPHVDRQRFKLHHGDLTDSTSLICIIQPVQPDKGYNLVALCDLVASFETSKHTADPIGTPRVLGTLRFHRLERKARLGIEGSHASRVGARRHPRPNGPATPRLSRSKGNNKLNEDGAGVEVHAAGANTANGGGGVLPSQSRRHDRAGDFRACNDHGWHQRQLQHVVPADLESDEVSPCSIELGISHQSKATTDARLPKCSLFGRLRRSSQSV